MQARKCSVMNLFVILDMVSNGLLPSRTSGEESKASGFLLENLMEGRFGGNPAYLISSLLPITGFLENLCTSNIQCSGNY